MFRNIVDGDVSGEDMFSEGGDEANDSEPVKPVDMGPRKVLINAPKKDKKKP